MMLYILLALGLMLLIGLGVLDRRERGNNPPWRSNVPFVLFLIVYMVMLLIVTWGQFNA